MRRREAADAVASLLKDEDERLREAVPGMLAAMGARGTLPKILPFVHDEEEDVRAAAIVAIGALGGDAKVLEPFAKDGSAIVSLAARIALLRIGRVAAREAIAAFDAAEKELQEELAGALAAALVAEPKLDAEFTLEKEVADLRTVKELAAAAGWELVWPEEAAIRGRLRPGLRVTLRSLLSRLAPGRMAVVDGDRLRLLTPQAALAAARGRGQ
jgi:HEAT repeat protein